MEVKVLGSRLYQWELGREIEITPPAGTGVDRVEFSHTFDAEVLGVKPREGSGVVVADIPNILLQSGEPIFVYLVYVDEDCLETTASYVLSVIKRPKPADYVYTETEVMTWAVLDKRITVLEESGGADGQLEMLIEADMLPAVHDVSGAILTDENGNIVLRY